MVASATLGRDGQQAVQPESLTLVQAAFSHYGFSPDYGDGVPGYFYPVVADQKVVGPILITHTQADVAVGLAYPLASMLAGQVASAFGDSNDRYGGLGRNGAQKSNAVEGRLKEVEGRLEEEGVPYAFERGKIYNLKADGIITEHSDIAHDEVVYALLCAVSAS